MNWVPGVSLGIYNATKVGLFALLFIISFFRSPLLGPSRFLSFSGMFLVLFVSSYALVSAYSVNAAYEALKDLTLPFGFILIIYNYKGSNERLLNVLYAAATTVGIVCLFGVLSYLTGYFDFTPPDPFNDTFSISGFGGYRTGWSNSIFLFVPLIIFYHLLKYGKLNWISIGLIFSIISSEFLSGGRAGLISSLLCVIVFSARRVAIVVPLAILATLSYVYLPQEVVTEKFRAAPEIVARGRNLKFITQDEYVDGLTSYRLVGYKVGFELFSKSPLIGFGFGQSDPLSDQMGYGPDIHNVWLKRMIEGGILIFLMLAFLFYSVYRVIIKNLTHIRVTFSNREYAFWVFFQTLFFIGLAISMVEPNYLIGSIQGEAFFWICLAFLMREQTYR